MAKRKSSIDHLESGRQPHIVHMIPPGAPGFREAAGARWWYLRRPKLMALCAS